MIILNFFPLLIWSLGFLAIISIGSELPKFTKYYNKDKTEEYSVYAADLWIYGNIFWFIVGVIVTAMEK